MPVAIVTGSGGLVGSESVAGFAERGFTVVGIENDTRARLFGPEASTARVSEALAEGFPDESSETNLDIRDADGIDALFARHAVSKAAADLRCTITGEPYTVFGHGGKQVRDNIHSADLVAAFAAFQRDPRRAAVYNLGGGRESNCSMLEAIALCEAIAGRELNWTLSDQARVGDHRWWISDLADFRRDYPDWHADYGIEATLRAIHDANVEHWRV
jgi:nucleoside-diphosphate-sugar epimerase